MKRPPGIWFLLSSGVLWLSIHKVYGLKATELIFKKATSTTSTTEPSVSNEPLADEVSTEAAAEGTNVTKSMLTGIPQIDYILDPNLPRELNGYNLSSYPFYNTMPENITFKCDGLHDGFYASIQHKCQVYHHCLSGTRYDFLCANYTAFDQKIFNCHFVSEVDCNNSQKYWHRNDALYQSPSTTTTTVVPPTPIVISPALTGSPKRPPPPLGRRRPPARRRPQYDYYDDEYEDAEKEDYYEPPPRRRRKRPRPRPRPVYDDDYEEYEDRHERRGSGRRNEDRRRANEDEDKGLSEQPNERRVNDNSQEKRNDKRRPYDDRRYKDERRREYEQDGGEDDEYTYRRRPAEKRRPNYERPRKPPRRPHDDDFYEDEKSDEKHGQRDQPPKIPRNQPESDGVALVKPHGPSSVYSQPRMPPRIKPPMPRNSQKPTSSEKPTTAKTHADDTVYYEDYDDAEASSKVTTTTKAPEFEPSAKRSKPRTTHKPLLYDDEYDDNPSVGSSLMKPSIGDERETNNRFAAPKFLPKENRAKQPSPTPSTTIPTTTVTTTIPTTTTTESPKSEPIMRVVKRPFLPSRGGNPYSVRGLQPVGAKALDTSNYETNLPETAEAFENDQSPSMQNGRQFPTQSQAKQPSLKEPPFTKPIEVLEDERTKVQIGAQSNFASKPEEQKRIKAKIPERNPLDINENDYDVTLNDALNPTIPNLPVRNFPTGFGVPPSDYNYNSIPRQRYNVGYNIPSESFLPKAIKQRDETIVAQPQNYRNHVYSNSQNFRGSPQLTQANTQGFYSVF